MIISEDKNVPELRFKGFTDAWEQRKLGDTLNDLKSGLSRMLSNDDIGLPVVRANNINEGQFDIQNDVKYWYLDDPKGANINNYIVHKNDILINFINSETKMGTATIVPKEPSRDTIYTTNILRARLNYGFDSNFWFGLTQTYKYMIKIKIITKPAVNQASFTTTDFKKLVFSFPEYEEQIKIGFYFKQLDKTIALHQQKLDRLKALKKGYLQVLFPLTGEVLPRVRFNIYSSTWKKCIIHEIASNTVGGGTPKTSIKEYWDGQIPWIQSSDLTEHDTSDFKIRKYITKKGLSNSAAKLVPENSIAIVTRVGVGKLSLIPFEYTTSQDFLSLSNLKIDNLFGVYSLYNMLQKELSLIQGTSIKGITKNELLNKKIMIPESLDEQNQIGTTIKKIDNIISNELKVIEKLQKLKKAYLQKMFI